MTQKQSILRNLLKKMSSFVNDFQERENLI